MEVFRNYEENFNEVAQSLKQSINQLSSGVREGRTELIRRIEGDLESAKDLMESLKLGMMGVPPSQVATTKAKVSNYDREYDRLYKEYRKVKIELDKQDLFAGGTQDQAGSELRITIDDHDARLLESTEHLQNASNYAKQTRIILEDTQSVSIETLHQLQVQREQLEKNKKKIEGIDATLTSTGATMRRIFTKSILNKLAVAGIAIAIIVVIIILIWLRWLK